MSSTRRLCPRRLAAGLGVAAALALTLLLAPGASAQAGALSYRDCITSNTQVVGCTSIPGATAGGGGGLSALQAAAVSTDGRNVYAASLISDAVARFDRDTTTGALTYRDCITSNINVGTCAMIDNPTNGGTNTGLNGVNSMTVSADGRSVYTTSSFSDAVARFDRNISTGALTYQDCITGDTALDDCEQIPGSGPGAADTPFDGLRSVTVSADGQSVYTASADSDAVARFDRNTTTGALTYQDCITSDTGTGCDPIESADANGTFTPLDGLTSAMVSADGQSVYTASADSDAVARFDRNTTTGALSYQDCISSSSTILELRCGHIPDPTPFGANTGLDSPVSVAVAPDGRSVYTASWFGDAVARFDRDSTTGALAYRGCITSNSNVDCTQTADAVAAGADTGLESLVSVATTDDGRSLYTASVDGDAVGRFDRAPISGALAYHGCITSDSNVNGCTKLADAAADGANTGLDLLQSVAVSLDGRSVYAASQDGDAVARFDRSLGGQPGPPGAPGPPDTTPPNITLKGKRSQKGAKLVKVKVTSDEAADLVGTGNIKVPTTKSGKSAAAAKKKRFKLKPQGKPIAAGDTQTLKLRLKKRAKRLTKRAHARGKKANAKITVTATDAAGNEASKGRKVKLKRKGKRR